jgi:hypothetical protein
MKTTIMNGFSDTSKSLRTLILFLPEGLLLGLFTLSRKAGTCLGTTVRDGSMVNNTGIKTEVTAIIMAFSGYITPPFHV